MTRGRCGKAMTFDPSRPALLVAEATRALPSAWRLADELRADRSGLPEWPDWCFLPIAGWLAIAQRILGRSASPANAILAASSLAAMGAWRVGQGVYRFDPDLYAALVETPVRGALPEALTRLPEWGVYVETPGMTYDEMPLVGFFSHMEWDVNRHQAELRFLLDVDDEGRPRLFAVAVPLVGDLTEALESTTKASGIAVSPDFDVSTMASRLEPLVSLLLYLCSERPDVSGEWPPSRPHPRRTKKGLRLFPPKVPPKPWVVGASIGSALRRARAGGETKADDTGGADRHRPRPHIRRAHWHTYRVGKGRQGTKLRWLSPILVGAGDDSDLPVTVHPVKGETP